MLWVQSKKVTHLNLWNVKEKLEESDDLSLCIHTLNIVILIKLEHYLFQKQIIYIYLYI